MADVFARELLSAQSSAALFTFFKSKPGDHLSASDQRSTGPFARWNPGASELESIEFHLGRCLGEDRCHYGVAAQARDRRDWRSVCEIHPGAPLDLVGDPNRLGQILINLFGNALKFTAQGWVTLRVEPGVESDWGRTRTWLRFSVIDTGIGIAAAKTGIIASSNFTQADSSTTRQYGGTGLGLSICKELVELMGRQIAYSETAEGSTFFFTAPFEIRKETETARRPTTPAARGSVPARNPRDSIPRPGF